VPRWVPLNTASRDYAELAAEARAIEMSYPYDLKLAQEVIAKEMGNLGSRLVNGKWNYGGQPVEIILLIRTEDERRAIGDYLGDQLEAIGFTVDRQYKSAAEASPVWMGSDPNDGLFHIYTGGWITTVIPRDLSGNFSFFYTDRGLILSYGRTLPRHPNFMTLPPA
jgi:peptide/nickel transport system substrate-binding protein